VTALMAPLRESSLRATILGLADFPTRQHDTATGKEASLWIRDRWQGYIQGRSDVAVALIEHEETPQPSISLTIRGSKYPDELVILGGHMDSINRSGGAAPGADDNASGIAVLDEVARAALELDYVPDRTVIFYAYAAEEVGLVGSAEIAERALDQELNVVGVLQLDMTNFNPSSNPYLAIVTDYTDATLNQFARQLIDTYVGLPWKDTECGYACSDHGSWQRRGFPVHYVHEATTDESNEDIHTSRDTLALSDGTAEHSLHFARYSAAFMAETAKGALTPVPECDASKPCPAGSVCEAGVCVPSVGGAGGGAGAAGASSGGANGGAGGSGGSSGSDPGGAGGTTIVGSLAGTGGASTGVPGQAGAANGSAAPPTVSNEPLACSCRVPAQRGSPSRFASLLLIITALVARRRRQSPIAPI
jgi:leucyl aminopeptidase